MPSLIEMCRLADGLPETESSVGFPEHHGSPDGYLPSPIVMGSAVAGATRQMRMMVILLIPFYEPIRLAEDLALLDLVAQGRLSVTDAAGYRPSEFDMFGVDPASRGSRLEETVEFLKAAWQGEEFDFRGRSPRVTPRPYRDARPPLIMGWLVEGCCASRSTDCRRVLANDESGADGVLQGRAAADGDRSRATTDAARPRTDAGCRGKRS